MFQQGFIRMAPISGTGLRPSVFGGSVEQTRTFHPTLAGKGLGETPSGWYTRAKNAIARFDDLFGRTKRIANQTEANRILAWIGQTSTQDSPAYRRKSVEDDIKGDVESFTPPNVNAYQVTRRQSRVEKLEDFNSDLVDMVTEAEIYYGKLPEPTVITQERLVGQGGTPGWVLPVVVGAGALAVAGVITILAGKK